MWRDLLATVQEMQERQKMAAAQGEDVDILAYYAEPPLVAVNLFHLRNGRVVDRREYFWEDQYEFQPEEFVAALIKQIYLAEQYIPDRVHVPVDFEDREVLEELLSERKGRRVEIHAPQRGPKKAMVELAEKNAQHSFNLRFRVLQPSSEAIKQALQDTLGLAEPPNRIECFDISHIHGADMVGSLVVWENGAMKRSEYRKFAIRTVGGVDDFAAMREVVGRRYARLQAEGKPLPDLVLVDGGVGQLHAAVEALESLGITTLPVAAIAKREETIFVAGHEDEPIQLDRYSPVLHLIQQIRDEAHRFAVSYHRERRAKTRLKSELDDIPGIGPARLRKLLREFGSLKRVREASEEQLAAVVGRSVARRIREYFDTIAPQPAQR